MKTEELQSVAGTVDSVIFQSGESGYTVCEIEDENGLPAVLVGTMPDIAEGDFVRAAGRWSNHPTYGRQFKVELYEKVLPTSAADILRYLSSGAVKGVGPKTAQRIVDEFGEDSLDVMENHPEWLANISGISRRKAEEISSAFDEISGARNVMMFCSEYFGSALSMKIYKKWGGRAVDMIKENPFSLCREFNGIGFQRADSIAAACGLAADSPERIFGGLNFVLQSAASTSGHTCLPRETLAAEASQLLSLSEEAVCETLDNAISRRALESTVSENTDFISLPRMMKAEKYISDKLTELQRLCPAVDSADTDAFILRCEREVSLHYAALQRQAVAAALSGGVTVLTGGPGTGKTTVIRALISIFEALGMQIALTAPTGRAAKRMSEATGCEAKTVHRLLEMEYNDDTEPRFLRCASCMLDENVFIIDESSMLDVILTEALLRAVRPGSRVIFIGDSDQLPSVGAGNVLSDIIESRRFATVRLTEIFRQSEDSVIVLAAHEVNEGRCPPTDNRRSDFFFMGRSDETAIADTIAELCRDRLRRAYGDELASGIQVITPSRKGRAGTEELNTLLQEQLNPPAPDKKEKMSHSTVFRCGDRVMQIKNNYGIEWEKNGIEGVGIFNGDIGVIESMDMHAETMTITFDERRVIYDFSLLSELELAYAVTVHKSQGSEYPCVVFPLYNCPPMLLTRNLLYTAITRASRMAVLVGRRSVLEQMVRNNRQMKRYTMLGELLK